MGSDPISETFPPGRKLPIRAPLQGSVPPFGSAVVQCMFIPSALIHTLVGNQGLTGAQPVPPSARLRSGRPLSYHQEDEFDSHPSTSPSSPRSDISPSPIGIIPCTPKTSKPRTKSLSDQFSHCGPGAECLALPGLSWRYAEFQPEACSRGLGRYDVHFYTGADGNSGRKRLAMKSSSVVFPQVAKVAN